MTFTDQERDDFFRGYVQCAVWADLAVGEGDDMELGGPGDAGPEDFDPESREAMRGDCDSFMDDEADDLALYRETRVVNQSAVMGQAGHDFWLNRNGHGAGFWDRGLGELGDRLDAAAKVYGEAGMVYTDGPDGEPPYHFDRA